MLIKLLLSLVAIKCKMTGGGLASLMATVFLLLLLYSSVKAEDDITCIRNYGDLKDALLDRETDNERLLLDTFYPPSGESIVHFVNVLYCISDNKTKCSPGSTNYTYYWADSRLLLVIEPYLLNALTLTAIKLHVDEVTLTISPPFCSNDTEANLQLLNTLTVWVSSLLQYDVYPSCILHSILPFLATVRV